MSIISRLDREGRGIILAAKELALLHQHEAVLPEHIMLAMLRDERLAVVRYLYELELDVDHMRVGLEKFMERHKPSQSATPEQIEFHPRTQEILKAAALEAERNPTGKITCFQLMTAMLYELGGLPGLILAEQGVDFRKLRQGFRRWHQSQHKRERLGELELLENGEKKLAQRALSPSKAASRLPEMIDQLSSGLEQVQREVVRLRELLNQLRETLAFLTSQEEKGDDD